MSVLPMVTLPLDYWFITTGLSSRPAKQMRK